MSEIIVGSILDGKVTGITKFGAFVALPEGKSGLVHISEIAYSYVNEVSDHLHEGQEVKVKIIGIDQANRINLSIKQVEPPPQRAPRLAGSAGGGQRSNGASAPTAADGPIRTITAGLWGMHAPRPRNPPILRTV